MEIILINGWYIFWVILSIGSFVGLYFLLRKKSPKTQNIVLFSLLAFALVLHFLKNFIPPYSLDASKLYLNSWFINICGANIALFPFLFLSKNKYAKDYMFYLGLLGGALAVLIPIEPIEKANQAAEWLDIIRFYIHHNILWQVPLLMVIFKLHKLSYKRILFVPISLCMVLMFIMINQILQSELGFIALRNNNFLKINYKNNSMIWAPFDEIKQYVQYLVPKFLRTVPVGANAGQEKYWPLLWLICPLYIILVPICFGLSMIFDHKTLKEDIKKLKLKFKK